MIHSDNIDKIFPALFEARTKFVKVKKDRQNTHLKNKYATLDSVLDAITPALTDQGLMVTQGMAEECAPGKMKLITMVIHAESGQWVKYFTEIPIVKNDPQGLGSAMTYGRRYALVSAFGLSQADDDAQLAVKSANDWKKDLDKCESLEELQDTFKAAYKASDAANRVIIKEHYDERKAKLEIGKARGFNAAKPQENIAQSVDATPKKAVESQPITSFE